ncbi:aminotransferase class III-fold pyridoxal phosphate-dependent enzyme [Bradyrhizobium sp. PMVTL-01]|uniref:aminotransferase class III-fold pyridoxal phosphate-dependent enzyme n=1 Tax=Bradyrhizobium sp. PMVTL-01 TaxID=3434999 RepID=UPI003F6EA0A4
MGGVIVSGKVHDALMQGPDNAIGLFHGYTYSAHPLACAASLAALDVYQDSGLFERACRLAPVWENHADGLRDLPLVVDIRNIGPLAAIDLKPRIESGVRIVSTKTHSSLGGAAGSHPAGNASR